VIGPNPEVRQYLPSTKFLCRMLIGGDTSAWKKYSRAGRRKWYSRTYDFFSQIHQDNDYKLPGAQHPKISLGETPFSIEEGMSTQTNFQHLVYLIWINKKNICFNHVLEILSIPSLWKWWMVAMLKLCKNLVHIFVLYIYLNLLVYFETRAWIKTSWEANAYDQI
jgi:hypothetical protein